MEFTKTIKTAGKMSICEGQPIFKTMGTSRLGHDFDRKIFPPKVYKAGPLKLDFALSFEGMFGLCGPAWATEMEIEGEVGESSLKFKVKNDELSAGIVAGASLGVVATGTLTHRHYHYHIHKPHVSHYNIKTKLDFDFELDFIELIKLALEKNSKSEDTIPRSTELVDMPNDLSLTEENGIEVKSYNILDSSTNSYMYNEGFMKASPKYMFKRSMLKNILEFPALIEFLPIYEAMKKLGIKFDIGVQSGIGINVKLEINEILNGTSNYKVIENKVDDGYINAEFDSNIDDGGIDTFKVTFKESLSLAVTIGAYCSLELFKIFHVHASENLDMLDYIAKIFGLDTTLKTYNYTLDAKKENLAHNCSESVEVIFV